MSITSSYRAQSVGGGETTADQHRPVFLHFVSLPRTYIPCFYISSPAFCSATKQNRYLSCPGSSLPFWPSREPVPAIFPRFSEDLGEAGVAGNYRSRLFDRKKKGTVTQLFGIRLGGDPTASLDATAVAKGGQICSLRRAGRDARKRLGSLTGCGHPWW